MDKNYKITVIIPVYKVEEYLDKCVQSVVKQTYKNLEIILVDDGSPDNCPKMCDDWAKKDARIKVIHKENGGLSSARNAGLDIATGEYITFLDSDDYIDLEMIETLYTQVRRFSADVAMCRFKFVYPNGEEKNIYIEDDEVTVHNQLDLVNLLLENRDTSLVLSCAKLYKKSIFDKLRFEMGKLHEDEFILLDVIERTNSLIIVNKCFYNYLKRPDSITGKKTIKNYEDAYEAFTKRYFRIKEGFNQLRKKNEKAYLFQLRSLYIETYKNFRDFSKHILKQFNIVYKTATGKTFKDFLFRYLRFVYIILSRIKRSFKN